MQVRNVCYDLGLFKTYKFSKPVISVGNITAGGTGKTPFTIYLAKLLVKQGKKVAIVSRGYGRVSKGFQLVSDGINKSGNTKIHGDEPVLISLKVPQAIVAVCEKRKTAIVELLQKYEIDLFILDDAFQHRTVHRDIDIVLVQKKSFKNQLVLPSGMLREFYFNLKRADIIISGDDVSNALQVKFFIGDVVNFDFEKIESLETINQGCVGFAGIAHPVNFKKELVEKGILIKSFIPFKDHYKFSEKDIEFLIGRCKSVDVSLILCTEKDMVKIREIAGIETKLSSENISLYAIAYNAQVADENTLLKKVNLP